MLSILYSRWDGTQKAYSLEAELALDELSRHLMQGLDLEQSLDWMRDQGFELAGTEFRVMGVSELLDRLRQEAEALLSRYNMDRSFDERWQRLEDALNLEQEAVREASGLESAAWNDLQLRRDDLPRRLAEALDRFRSYDWKSPEAEAIYRELLDDIDETRALEDFRGRNHGRLSGSESLSYEEALELMRQVEALGRAAQDLIEGNFESLPLDQLRELLGEGGVQSILILRDLESALENAGYLREGEGGLELTPRAIRRLGELALEEIYLGLSRGGPGSHDTRHSGASLVNTESSRKYAFGEPAHLDLSGTLRNALRRLTSETPLEGPGTGPGRLRIEPDDLQVYGTDQLTDTTTVLLLDMSWSMSWSGRWPAAKQVAIAMDFLIRTRFPRDQFFVVGFYTRARELRVNELPELCWNMEDPFTNLQDGLRVAQRLIERYPSTNTQVIVITDGQPTAYFVEDELRVEWPSGYGGTSPRAIHETLREVRRVTKKGITINTFMLDDSVELVRFVEAMTRINKGRAFYSAPGSLGQYIMVDYMSRKRRRIGR